MFLEILFGCIALACLGLLLLFLNTRRRYEALRQRFPQELLDADAEVKRLNDRKIALNSELVLLKNQAERDAKAVVDEAARRRDEIERTIQARRADWDHKFTEAMAELHRLQG